MKKIIVIGCPGAGKSVFSKRLSEITQIPLYHIDMMYHNEDRTHISREGLKEKFKKIFNEEKWIIDGNYQKTLEMRLKECDTVFLLDFPTEVCIEGAKSRVGKKREDMPWIDESFDETFKETILNFEKEKLPKIYEMLDKYKENRKIIVFKSREETDRFIEKNNVINRKLILEDMQKYYKNTENALPHQMVKNL